MAMTPCVRRQAVSPRAAATTHQRAPVRAYMDQPTMTWMIVGPMPMRNTGLTFS